MLGPPRPHLAVLEWEASSAENQAQEHAHANPELYYLICGKYFGSEFKYWKLLISFHFLNDVDLY